MNANTCEMTEILTCNNLFSSPDQSLRCAKLHFLTGRRDMFSTHLC